MRSFIMIIFIVSLITLSANLFAQNFDHAIFDEILQNYVKDGLVDCRSLKENRSDLTNYLKKLEQVNLDDFNNWSKDEQMAFWINAYNAITIEGILQYYPIQWGSLVSRVRFPQNSIRQIGGFWDMVFIKVMGKDLTLNDIEHKILRKEFDDPRIHFVIVCASIGCPILESRAFFADDLNQRLAMATLDFINNPEKVRLDKTENILYLSSIFDWYKEDFLASMHGVKKLEKYSKNEKAVMEFVTKYFSEAEQKYIIRNQPNIKYLNYDWSLNEQKK